MVKKADLHVQIVLNLIQNMKQKEIGNLQEQKSVLRAEDKLFNFHQIMSDVSNSDKYENVKESTGNFFCEEDITTQHEMQMSALF